VNQPEQRNSSGSTLLAYLQLVRLPNVFLAVTDVVMGFLVTHAVFEPGDGGSLGLLILSSTLFYMAGMVLNDVFDAAVDAEERPKRPIPSGRVSLATARWVGWQLLGAGIAVGSLVSVRTGEIRPAIVVVVLAGCIVLYDAFLKRFPIGPLGMGACRMLNVLLGMSLTPEPWHTMHWLIAGAVGIYIAGVTWFSRGEAERSHRGLLIAGMLVILLGVAMLGFLPGVAEDVAPLVQVEPGRWTLLVAVLGAMIAMRCLWAIADPSPSRVQMTVKQSLVSLVILNAAVGFAMVGPLAAIAILVFLIPATVLGPWIYST
jgi:4-hydroxybenzoate polyprenyltransferase